jgi:hypothetical protein
MFELSQRIVGSKLEFLVFDASVTIAFVFTLALNQGTISGTYTMLRARCATFKLFAIMIKVCVAFSQFTAVFNTLYLGQIVLRNVRWAEIRAS